MHSPDSDDISSWADDETRPLKHIGRLFLAEQRLPFVKMFDKWRKHQHQRACGRTIIRSYTLLVIKAHQYSTLKTSIRSNSDSWKYIHSFAIAFSPRLCKIGGMEKFIYLASNL